MHEKDSSVFRLDVNISSNGKYKLKLPQGLTVRVQANVDSTHQIAAGGNPTNQIAAGGNPTNHTAAGGNPTNHSAAEANPANQIAAFKLAPADKQVKIENESVLNHSIEESGEHTGDSQLVG